MQLSRSYWYIKTQHQNCECTLYWLLDFKFLLWLFVWLMQCCIRVYRHNSRVMCDIRGGFRRWVCTILAQGRHVQVIQLCEGWKSVQRGRALVVLFMPFLLLLFVPLFRHHNFQSGIMFQLQVCRQVHFMIAFVLLPLVLLVHGFPICDVHATVLTCIMLTRRHTRVYILRCLRCAGHGQSGCSCAASRMLLVLLPPRAHCWDCTVTVTRHLAILELPLLSFLCHLTATAGTQAAKQCSDTMSHRQSNVHRQTLECIPNQSSPLRLSQLGWKYYSISQRYSTLQSLVSLQVLPSEADLIFTTVY